MFDIRREFKSSKPPHPLSPFPFLLSHSHSPLLPPSFSPSLSLYLSLSVSSHSFSLSPFPLSLCFSVAFSNSHSFSLNIPLFDSSFLTFSLSVTAPVGHCSSLPYTVPWDPVSRTLSISVPTRRERGSVVRVGTFPSAPGG